MGLGYVWKRSLRVRSGLFHGLLSSRKDRCRSRNSRHRIRPHEVRILCLGLLLVISLWRRDMKEVQVTTNHIDRYLSIHSTGRRHRQERRAGHSAHKIDSDHRGLLSGSRCESRSTACYLRKPARSSHSSRSSPGTHRLGPGRLERRPRGEDCVSSRKASSAAGLEEVSLSRLLERNRGNKVWSGGTVMYYHARREKANGGYPTRPVALSATSTSVHSTARTLLRGYLTDHGPLIAAAQTLDNMLMQR